jgi:hypothetical protein
MAATEGVRIAQHYVQVVGTQNQTDAELRVRRLYADVLVSNIGAGPVVHEKTVNQDLGLTDVAQGFSGEQPTSSTMTLVDVAYVARDIPLEVSNTLAFASLGGRTLAEDASNDLGLFELMFGFNFVGDRNPAGNTLNLIQTVTSLSSLDAEHDLGLIQTVEVRAPFKPVIQHNLALSDHTSTPFRFFMEQSLGLLDRARTPLPTQHLYDTLTFVQEAPIGRFDQDLAFVQTVEVAFSKTAANTINLTDAVVVQMIYRRTFTHSDFIGHSLSWYEDTPCSKKQYTPFQGESTFASDVTPPSDILQDPQGDTGNFSLYQPYLGVPTSKVTLRKPELDNRDRNAYTRVNRETRGGKIIVYADPTWPQIRTLAVTIVGLTETDVDDMQTFMLDTVGQEIGLTDWEGRLWKGFITNPNDPATQDGRARWTMSFEFEGEMLEVEQPGNDDGQGMSMNLTHSVTAFIDHPLGP